MGRILVTEAIAAPGLDALRAAGHDVDVALDLTPAELLDAVGGAAALIIRSATKVTADVLEAGKALIVVGRAGIGLDNVDVAAATQRGVMVVNAPESNVLSAAEHSVALLLAQARNVPQAHAALTAGRWERSRWEGVELHGKTLGIVGLGRVGTLVAQRAAAFGMHLVAYDPYVSAERARQLGVSLLDMESLMGVADFVTVHLPKTQETAGLIDASLLAKAKPGMRIVNTSRGGIVDEEALAGAVADGRIGGAALDVFVEEPTTASPLFHLDRVVVTPHLGASTREAQDKAGLDIAEQVGLALAGEFVPFAVNVSAAEADEAVRPFLPLAERLGRVFTALAGSLPSELEVSVEGALADHDTRIVSLAVLRGLLSATSDVPVTYVNAPQVAAERGLEMRSVSASATRDYVNLVTLRGGGHAVGGTIFAGGEPRITEIDDHEIELPIARWMLVVRNDDRVGMVASVAGSLARAGANIVDLKLGRSEDRATAIMAFSFEEPVPVAALDELAGAAGIHQVVALADV